MPIRDTLNRLYEECNFNERMKNDPIEFPHRYRDPLDIEVSGFIASAFAYGRIELFKPVIEGMLISFGKSPYDFLLNFKLSKAQRYFNGTNYRFSKERDVIAFIYMISHALQGFGSLKELFYSCYKEDDKDIGNALTGFVSFFLNIDTTPVYGKNIKPHGLSHFFPLPSNGSACKRMNLFLRWMVRRRDIDFGLWQRIHPSRLIIPLDTHIARISRCLALTKRTSPDWKTAKEITESLKRFDPDDPLRYDFALCHHGISGKCRGKKDHLCSNCLLYDINHRE
ncbi:MAG: TIGR02757 family protein [Thermodesulfovibrionia bacterium]